MKLSTGLRMKRSFESIKNDSAVASDTEDDHGTTRHFISDKLVKLSISDDFPLTSVASPSSKSSFEKNDFYNASNSKLEDNSDIISMEDDLKISMEKLIVSENNALKPYKSKSQYTEENISGHTRKIAHQSIDDDYATSYGPSLPLRRPRYLHSADYIIDRIIRKNRRRLWQTSVSTSPPIQSYEVVSIPSSIGPHPLTDYKISSKSNTHIRRNGHQNLESSDIITVNSNTSSDKYAREYTHSEWFINDDDDEYDDDTTSNTKEKITNGHPNSIGNNKLSKIDSTSSSCSTSSSSSTTVDTSSSDDNLTTDEDSEKHFKMKSIHPI